VRQSGQESQERLKALTARFRNALKKSVEGIIEAGRVLIDAYDPKSCASRLVGGKAMLDRIPLSQNLVEWHPSRNRRSRVSTDSAASVKNNEKIHHLSRSFAMARDCLPWWQKTASAPLLKWRLRA